jgi:hypothetical protein
MFDPVVSSIAHIRAGKVRPLAVTTSMRSETLPNTPTVGDFVPGYEASGWYGIGAPRNTPVEVIDKLNKETNAGLADPNMKAQLADLGGTVLAGSPADSRVFSMAMTAWAAKFCTRSSNITRLPELGRSGIQGTCEEQRTFLAIPHLEQRKTTMSWRSPRLAGRALALAIAVAIDTAR